MIARLKMTESELQYAILDLAKRLGLLAMHIRDSRRNLATGFPDLVLAGPGGVVFAELKNDKHQPTDMQMRWLGTLEAGGAEAYLWRPEQWTNGAVASVLQRIAKPREVA